MELAKFFPPYYMWSEKAPSQRVGVVFSAALLSRRVHEQKCSSLTRRCGVVQWSKILRSTRFSHTGILYVSLLLDVSWNIGILNPESFFSKWSIAAIKCLDAECFTSFLCVFMYYRTCSNRKTALQICSPDHLTMVLLLQKDDQNLFPKFRRNCDKIVQIMGQSNNLITA